MTEPVEVPRELFAALDAPPEIVRAVVELSLTGNLLALAPLITDEDAEVAATLTMGALASLLAKQVASDHEGHDGCLLAEGRIVDTLTETLTQAMRTAASVIEAGLSESARLEPDTGPGASSCT